MYHNIYKNVDKDWKIQRISSRIYECIIVHATEVNLENNHHTTPVTIEF